MGMEVPSPPAEACSSSAFKEAVKKMRTDKSMRCSDINKSIKRKAHDFRVGQWVYVRNRLRKKFDPLYFEDPWIIESVEKNGVIVHNAQLTKRKIRHIDDVKPFTQSKNTKPAKSKSLQQKSTSKTFYSLPPPTISDNLQPSAPLLLDAYVAADYGVEHMATPPPPPRRCIAADRPQRRCKREEDYTEFY